MIALFAGSLLSVTLGVALVQSSLLLLITAATLDTPPGLGAAERMEFSDNVTAAVSMLGLILGMATFLAGFIISSTFAFTVAQRRRDFALLRLVGAGRGQVRLRLLREAVLLGGLGAALGVPTGLLVMAAQAALMRHQGFVPPGFEGEWRPWILAVSFGTGIALALAGAMVAAHRAARVRPLEALRDTGTAARVMTATRWTAGLIFFGGALALVIVAPVGGPGGGAAMAMNVPLPAAIAAAALSPLVVPLLGRLLPTGSGVIGALARANLWDARRRSASVAAPLIVLVALVIGTAAAGASITDAGITELRRQTQADLVVTATGPVGPAITAVPGVASASTELSIPATVVTDDESSSASALVIDPAAYARAHSLSQPASALPARADSAGPAAGSPAARSDSVSPAASGGLAVRADSAGLAALRGRAVAVGPGGEIPSSGSIRLALPDLDLGSVPVVASVPATISGGANLLLPAGLVPERLLAAAPAQSFVTLEPGASADTVRAALGRIGTVTDADDWLRADAAARSEVNNKIMVAVMGLGALYALIGVVNSIVIGAAARRREFAAARVGGLTRGQVLRAALLESSAVTAAGILLGCLAAAGALIAAARTTSAVTGTATVTLPWTLIGAVCAVALLVTGATSLITSWSATRPAPITLLAARE
ncbi:putative ABC transport system permease protein [Actinoplanes tereljensis]|uniref:ABC transporter permease n=1 Tax=Paractinoplanes tereljensis TaxID=571912 RepID=A0A919NFX0_9ACTN|nr:ABC transporter permease [Actinoplanes tereljensis]GIF17384.1 ABC transporter permease [Actinoplanes tereljensis]